MGCKMSKDKKYIVKYIDKNIQFEIYKNNKLYGHYKYDYPGMNMNHIEKTLEKGLNKNELKIIKVNNRLKCTIVINK